ncbi:hypothetical protein [Capillimicrobium parvum]|nr:hypothetical protein [Capillimicrobium parvum]
MWAGLRERPNIAQALMAVQAMSREDLEAVILARLFSAMVTVNAGEHGDVAAPDRWLGLLDD